MPRPTVDASPSAASEHALGEVFRSLKARLHHYVRRRVRDPEVAEDLVQDVFVKAMAGMRVNRAPRHLAAWLYAVARSTVVDHYRSAPPGSIALEEASPSELALMDGADEHLHQQLATCLRPLMDQLPAIYRDTLLATDIDGRTLKSMAGEQGLSVSALKSRASRGRALLKARLLACCEVAQVGGLVVDYGRHPNGGCGRDCS